MLIYSPSKNTSFLIHEVKEKRMFDVDEIDFESGDYILPADRPRKSRFSRFKKRLRLSI